MVSREAVKSVVYDPTKETEKQAAKRAGLPACCMIPDVSKPGAMAEMGLKPAFRVRRDDGTFDQWYRRG